MTEPPILTPRTARNRFLGYFGLKLGGLAALFGGVFLAKEAGGATVVAVLLLIVGAASLFVRPKHLGLTTRPER
ncbi:MAG: hypothetical protein RL490_2715 [Pseudomonadota bacterium]|jgi:uncharacterized membrane protein YhaH (DUF805 family)